MSMDDDKLIKVAIWFDGKQEFETIPFMFFVLSANAAQSSFVFHFPDPPDELSFSAAEERMNSGKEIHREKYDAYIFITRKSIEGNLFFLEYGPLVLATTYKWKQKLSPPSVFEYLFHSMLCGVLYVLCNNLGSHENYSVGCQFDYTRLKEVDRVDIALGYICREHRSIIGIELGESVLADVEKLFGFQWLGKADDANSPRYKMQDLFKYDLRRDSGFKKSFVERVQSNLDSIWFDLFKEIIKGAVLIAIAYIVFKLGLKN